MGLLSFVANAGKKLLGRGKDEENIKNEEPYYIRKYKDKWLVSGTFPESMNGGGFEIVINAKTSQIESLYQTGR